MFNWFKEKFSRPKHPTWDDVPDWNKVNNDMEKIGNDMSKVISFPELKAVPAPEPEPEKPGKIFYRMGLTDNNRVAFSMGYSEIAMNRAGVQRLIDQLEFYKGQLTQENVVQDE